MNQAQAIMSGFDLSNLDTPYTPVTFKVTVIEDLEGNPKTGFIIVGKNSPEYQDVANKIRIGNIQRAGKRKQQLDTSTIEGAAVVAKVVTSNENEIALAVIVDWFGFEDKTGEVAFDKEVTERLLAKYPQWQVKVNAALDNDSNFMKV